MCLKTCSNNYLHMSENWELVLLLDLGSCSHTTPVMIMVQPIPPSGISAGDRTSLVVRHDLRGCCCSTYPLDPRGSSSGGICSGTVAHGKTGVVRGSRVLYAIGCP